MKWSILQLEWKLLHPVLVLRFCAAPLGMLSWLPWRPGIKQGFPWKLLTSNPRY